MPSCALPALQKGEEEDWRKDREEENMAAREDDDDILVWVTDRQGRDVVADLTDRQGSWHAWHGVSMHSFKHPHVGVSAAHALAAACSTFATGRGAHET